MDRKALAQETLKILEQGYYEPQPDTGAGQKTETRRILIQEALEHSVGHSVLITPEDGAELLKQYDTGIRCARPETRVENISTVEAVRLLAAEGKTGPIVP